LIILIVASASFYLGTVFAIPAANINAVCEPGGCGSQDCSYYIYKDTITMGSNTNVTFAKNCVTGGNDYRETTSGPLIQDVLNAIAATPTPSLPPPGGVGQGAQFSIVFGIGFFYIGASLTVNFPGTGATANAMHWRGQGEDKTALILDNNVNGNMTNVVNMGDKFEITDMKFSGNKVKQTGISSIFWFEPSNLGSEYIITNTEFRDCLTNCIYFQNVNVAWNDFSHVWFLNSPIGIDYKTAKTDIRITGCKFGLGSGTPIEGIKFEAGNVKNVAIVGNVFDDAQITSVTGNTVAVSIVGNVFSNAPNNAIYYTGTGLGAYLNTKSIITGNVFSTTTGTNVAIYLARYVDGMTITANQFAGYTSSSTVPITLIQTTQKNNTLVNGNSGMGSAWVGFGIPEPAFPGTGVDQLNTNPFPVRAYITGVGTGITAYQVTDPLGTVQAFTTTVSVGDSFALDPYAKIRFTFTGTPTWNWYGEANLL